MKTHFFSVLAYKCLDAFFIEHMNKSQSKVLRCFGSHSCPCADKKIPPGSPFLSSAFFTEGRTDLPRNAIEPEGSSCFSRGPVPVFLRKQVTTCDFPGVGTDPVPMLFELFCIIYVFVFNVPPIAKVMRSRGYDV